MFDHVKEAIGHLKHSHKGGQEVLAGGQEQASGYTGPTLYTKNANAGQPMVQPPTNPDLEPHTALSETTQKAIDVFLYSKQDNGEIGGIGYWQTANGYTAIALRDSWSGSNHNATVLRDVLTRINRHHRDYINEFNDDTLWWAQCLLDFYQSNPDNHSPDTAFRIWAHVHKSMLGRGQATVRGLDMEGAVMWTTRPGEDQTNAITTGLFCELSARLATLNKFPDQHEDLLDAAEKSFDWIMRCRYRGVPECIVLDTIKLKSQECVDWTFSYTTGQAIAAASALYTALSQTPRSGNRKPGIHVNPAEHEKPAPTYLALACDMARQAMARPGWVEADGTLTEHGAYGRGNHEEWKNDDAVGFKSILLRSLAKLYIALKNADTQHDLQQSICNFIKRQYDSLQQRNTNGNGQYGPWWAGPMAMPTSHSQLAALDVMAAIHLVQ